MAQPVDQLVARDRRDPRTDGPVEIPGMSLQMDGQEGLLNKIFRLAAIQANAGAIAARCCPQDGRNRSEKLTISTSIAVDRRAHQRVKPPRTGINSGRHVASS